MQHRDCRIFIQSALCQIDHDARWMMARNYRHTGKHLELVIVSREGGGETKWQMGRQRDGLYQVVYLQASRCYSLKLILLLGIWLPVHCRVIELLDSSTNVVYSSWLQGSQDGDHQERFYYNLWVMHLHGEVVLTWLPARQEHLLKPCKLLKNICQSVLTQSCVMIFCCVQRKYIKMSNFIHRMKILLVLLHFYNDSSNTTLWRC